MADKRKSGLGRSGLSSLLGNSHVEDINNIQTAGSSMLEEIPLSEIETNPNQPRTEFDPEELVNLSESIKTFGIIVPITVRKMGDHSYQLIAGERRLRASKMAGKVTIPAYISTASDEESAEMALIENIQRADLNAIEVALSFKNLMEKCNYTQEEMSERVGKSRSSIANHLRLLTLPSNIQIGVKEHKIEMGHARALLSLDNAGDMEKIYDRICSEGLSVRAVEKIVKEQKESSSADETNPSNKKSTSELPEEYKALEEQFRKALSSKVVLTRDTKGKGKITIPFSSDEEFEKIMDVFDSILNDVE